MLPSKKLVIITSLNTNKNSKYMKYLKLLLTTFLLSILMVNCSSDDDGGDTDTNSNLGTEVNRSNLTGTFKGTLTALASFGDKTPEMINGLPLNHSINIINGVTNELRRNNVEVQIKEFSSGGAVNDIKININGIDNNFEFEFTGLSSGEGTIVIGTCVECYEDNLNVETTGGVSFIREKRELLIIIGDPEGVANKVTIRINED